MPRFYISLNKITGRKALPNFSPITSIGDIGFRYAFYNCTELTGSISFPSLISIGNRGLNSTFENCTGLTEIHFKSSLSGNSECTASNMACTNATIYFDLP